MNSAKFTTAHFKLAVLIVSSLAFALIFSCERTSEISTISTEFVGDGTCASCHSEQTNAWLNSHHDYAMREAGENSVHGDFNDAEFVHNGEKYFFFKQDSAYFLRTNNEVYPVLYTFGWEPLQQYLLDIGKGKLQALNIAWDTEKATWFALNPNENVAHGEWLHFTGVAMNWNTMCADCHSTNLQQNYFAEADSFHTTFSSINVSCEACHGPGAAHVRLMESDSATIAGIERIQADLRLTSGTTQQVQIDQCAQCHSRRQELDDNYQHKGDFLDHFSPDFLHPELYFADGQIKDEVYVYGSFLQSKMYASGIKCSDCHDPHSLKLRASITDNSLCMNCHEPTYNSLTHTFHQENTEASLCVSCHMTGRMYMEVDFRRDHSFRVPRPDLSAEYGTPNACTGCHTNKSEDWASQAIINWYGPDRVENGADLLAQASRLSSHFPENLKTAIRDTLQSEIVRATLVWYLREFPSQQNAKLLNQLVKKSDDLVRVSATNALATYPPELNSEGVNVASTDPLLAVRVGAASGLELPNRDYETYLEHNRYFPEGEMNRGIYFEKRGDFQAAINAYQSALHKHPSFNPARINLAHLYNRMGNNQQAIILLAEVIQYEPDYGHAYYSLALVLAEENQLEDAIINFEKAALLMPKHDRLRYNLALTFQTLERRSDAETAYLEAIDISSEAEYLYGICTLYLQDNAPEKALKYAETLVKMEPANARFAQLLAFVNSRL